MNRAIVVPFLLLLFANYSFADNDLFQKVFGKKEGAQSVDLAVFYLGRDLGSCSFEIIEDKLSHVDGLCLRGRLQSDFSNELVRMIPSRKTTISDLREIKFIYRKDLVQVSLLIEPKFTKAREQFFEYGPRIDGKKVFRPAKWSHILNYWLEYRALEEKSVTQNEHSGEIDLESALHFDGHVLENQFEVKINNKTSTDEFIRKKSLYIYDMPKKNLRLEIGDIGVPVTTDQTNLNLLGLSLSKNYSLTPYKRITPISKFEFVLEKRSYVTIFVNDRPVRSEILDEGKHSIKDLVLEYGRNRVRVKVQEVGGSEKEFNFAFSSAEELLRKGLSRYSLNLGTKATYNLKPDYEDEDSLTFSGFYNRGLSSSLTTGLALQQDQNNSLLTPSFIFSTDVGLFRTFLNFSHDDQTHHSGIKPRLDYEYFSTSKKYNIRNYLSYEHLSPFYNSFNSVSDLNSFDHVIRYDFNWFYNDFVSYGLDLNYSHAAIDTKSDKYTTGLNVGLRPFKNSRLNLSFQRKRDELGEYSSETTLFFNYSFVETGHFLSNFYDSESKRNFAQVSYSPYDRQDTFNYSASIESEGSRNDVDLVSGFRSRYFSSDILANINENSSDEYRFRLRGGIAMSSNLFEFTPTIYDSYGLIEGKESLEKKKIGVLSQVGGVLSGEFRKKLSLPALTGYHYYKVNMDPTHLDFGSSYDVEEFFIAPTYKSVVPVRLGREKSYIVVGRFVGENTSLKVGKLVSTSGREFDFFTNRKGEFTIHGVSKGLFDLRLDDQVYRTQIHIKNQEAVLVNLGNVGK